MSVKKILIVCSYSRTSSEIASFCERAFGELGLSAGVFFFHPYRYSSRLGRRIFGPLEYRIAKWKLLSGIRGFSPDLVLVVKGDELLPETVAEIRERFRIPVADWWIDDPGFIGVSSGLSPAYDIFFTNDPDSVPVHRSGGCRFARFLTFACSPAAHRAVELTKEEADRYGCDIIFVGLLTPDRVKTLEALKDFKLKIWSLPVVREYLPGTGEVTRKELSPDSPLYPLITGRELWGGELAKAYSAAKIVLNIHSHGKSDPNMRVVETTACGAFLLTEDRSGLKDVFDVGRELVCFRGLEELRERARYYLANESERKSIARQGQARAYRDHTYVHRMKELLGYVEEFGKEGRAAGNPRDRGLS